MEDAALSRLLDPPYEPPPETARVGVQSLVKRLQPRYRIVPFSGRDSELAELMDWAESPEPLAVWRCIGPGGQGKTRLGAELAYRLHSEAGWLTGFVKGLAAPEDLRKALEAAASDVLLAIDYAGRRAEQVKALLGGAELRGTRRTRLLLLERSRGEEPQGEWWKKLGDSLQISRVAKDAVANTRTRPVMPLSAEARDRQFREAQAAYGSRGAAPIGPPPRDDNTLALHIAALLGKQGDRDELLDELLKREGSYWREVARQAGLTAEPAVLPRAVALCTMARPSGQHEISALLELVFEKPHLARAEAWLRELYPGPEGSIGPLEPDLVGEALIARHLERDAHHVFQLLHGVSNRVTRNVFDALGRSASSQPKTQPKAVELLRSMPSRLWPLAVQESPTLDEAFPRLLTTAFENGPEIGHDLILRALPEQTVCLRELAVAAQRRELAELKKRPAPADEHLAGSLNNLSNRLSELGRREEALEAAQQAVDLYCRLAKVQPDAFEPYLAGSLNNLSNRLSELGRREEALEAVQQAVDVYDRRAKARPDVFEPYLAGSLNNLSNRLSGLGRREEALEAVQQAVSVYGRLAEARHDAFEPDLAMSLNNLSVHLSELRRRQEALEAVQQAVEIRRRLAKARPDAFEPDLAMSVNNLSGCLSELGRREEALEAIQQAVEIRQRLAEARPSAFEPALARSLNNLSIHLRKLGKREEAIEAVQQAVEVYGRLAKDRPDAFEPDLAMSLNNLSGCLSELGRREEALEAVQQAVKIRRRLAKDRPVVFEPYLARSLKTLALRFSELGRSEDAEAATAEAEQVDAQLRARKSN